MNDADLDNPATKRDLQGLEDRLIERITDSETRLLKAFYNFAESNNKRIAVLEGNEAAIRSRLSTIEDRLLEVERRLNMPPAS